MIARNIIVIGASAGGIDAIRKLAASFPADLQAAVFVTMHLAERSEGILPDILNRAGPLPAAHPWEETRIQPGRIYVAPPDYHLILTPETVHVGHGPRENLQRPCINTMFRSAAAAHGEHVAGVLLTGLLDDGAAGLWEIQQHGGATIVQDPEEAQYRSMPESAIRGLNVQYILRLHEMAPLLKRLTMGENNTFRDVRSGPPEEERTLQACPECGGVMRLYRLGGLKEYSCHVGHRFGLKTMIAEKSSVVERSMWTALSQSEELSDLLEKELSEIDPEHAPALHE
ncbi:MAG: chemotaxis protein CheB, partial [Terriglobus roseus]|nr:chemotaxis protein CheB [Terriglobus roseus]